MHSRSICATAYLRIKALIGEPSSDKAANHYYKGIEALILSLHLLNSFICSTNMYQLFTQCQHCDKYWGHSGVNSDSFLAPMELTICYNWDCIRGGILSSLFSEGINTLFFLGIVADISPPTSLSSIHPEWSKGTKVDGDPKACCVLPPLLLCCVTLGML